jgi:hypothetical protein
VPRAALVGGGSRGSTAWRAGDVAAVISTAEKLRVNASAFSEPARAGANPRAPILAPKPVGSLERGDMELPKVSWSERLGMTERRLTLRVCPRES